MLVFLHGLYEAVKQQHEEEKYITGKLSELQYFEVLLLLQIAVILDQFLFFLMPLFRGSFLHAPSSCLDGL